MTPLERVLAQILLTFIPLSSPVDSTTGAVSTKWLTHYHGIGPDTMLDHESKKGRNQGRKSPESFTHQPCIYKRTLSISPMESGSMPYSR